MSENSKIEWTDHTFNPFIGCTKVSPGCDHCYAEHLMDKRMHKVVWGAGQARIRTSPANWRKPLQWNARHDAFFAEHGRRQRVFCASLADVFDNAVDPAWRMDLFRLIADTPNLDWLLLTKRIGNVRAMCSGDGLMFDMLAERVWLGATVVNQEEADRDIPKLLATPARVRFLSMEPLLGPVDVSRWLDPTGIACPDICPDSPYVDPSKVKTTDAGNDVVPLCPHCGEIANWTGYDDGVDWVIVGGESGRGARPMHPGWARHLRDQCAAAGVQFFFKQWGKWGPFANEAHFTHCGEEKHAHAWVDATTGDHGECWIYDDNDWTWTNWTGEPPQGSCGRVSKAIAVMGNHGKKEAGRELDGRTHDEFPGDMR